MIVTFLHCLPLLSTAVTLIILNPIDFEVGALINHRYSVFNRIGFGSFASAFRVVDTKDGYAEKVCKTIRISEDPSNKHESEVLALKSCLGLSRWPQISDHFATKSFKTIVVSFEGESIYDVLERNTPSRFSNANILRLSYGIFDAIQTLHGVGFVHRDITQDNVMLKRVKEGVMVNMIDLGNCAKVDPPTKCMYNSINTSLHVMKTHLYTTYDDLISALYLLIEISGSELFDLKMPLLQAKEKLHSHPSSCLDKSRKWLGDIITLIDQQKAQKSSNISTIWSKLENAIPEVSPYSPITFKTVNGKLILE